MFDEDHPEQLHERPHGTQTYHQTRATLWEIHPIIEFEVRDPRSGRFVSLDDWEP
jgi:hypothetical protein